MIPIGIAIRRTKNMPPNTSEAVTGAAAKISSLTGRRSTNDSPRDRSTTSLSRNLTYWT